MMGEILLSAKAGRVLTLTMNRPEVLNALNQEATRALRTAYESLCSASVPSQGP